MDIRIPKMDEWEQISGDMNPGAYGAILARSDGDAIELIEIQPVREYVGDGEAAEVGFPFWSREAYFDLDDLQLDSRDVESALKYIGMSKTELEEDTPTQRALVIAEALLGYGRADEGPSGWADDVFPEKAKYWFGTKGPDAFYDEDEEFRVDVLGEEPADDED